MDEAAKLAAQMNITLAELLGDAKLPKAAIARKYVHGQPLVEMRSCVKCQQICGISMTGN
jgi:hypothetical protein